MVVFPNYGTRALMPQKKASRRHARGERAAGALRVQARTLDARSLSTHARAGLTLALDPRSRWTHARAGLTLALRVARTERRRGRGDGHPRGGLHHLLQLARRPEAGCAMRRAPMTRRQMTRRGAAESVVEQSGMGTSTSKKPRLLPRRREHTGHARATSRSWAAQRSGEQAAAAASVRGGGTCAAAAAAPSVRRRHVLPTCCRPPACCAACSAGAHQPRQRPPPAAAPESVRPPAGRGIFFWPPPNGALQRSGECATSYLFLCPQKGRKCAATTFYSRANLTFPEPGAT